MAYDVGKFDTDVSVMQTHETFDPCNWRQYVPPEGSDPNASWL